MFDMFDFTPVDYDPFKKAASAKTQPARPVTPNLPMAPPDMLNNPSGVDLPSPMLPPAPLPSWIPPNVQNYINQAPSYEEGQSQGLMPPMIAGAEPNSLTPQIDDIRRLFRNRIVKNAPIGASPGMSAEQLRGLMKLPGFAGFAGGDEI